MYKVPAKIKKPMINELKRFLPLISNLQAKGKKSSEDDARILLNDILCYVLGYDKYNELKTELRERNGRIDYIVKLTEGPNSKKKNRFDIVIEAKAAHIKLNQSHIDQTLSYCLSKGIDYFFLTNAVKWQLYKVKHAKKNPDAILVHEVDFGSHNCIESLAEEFYLFSRASYLAKDWCNVSQIVKATKAEDVAAVIMSEKVIKLITRELAAITGTKLSADYVKDIVENQIVKSTVSAVNTKLLRKVDKSNTKKRTPKKKTSESKVAIEVENNVLNQSAEPVLVAEESEQSEVKNVA